MDHTTVLARLSPEDKTSLTERSNSHALWHLALYCAALAVCTTWIMSQALLWQPVMVIQGIFLSFLFTLCHECTHKTPFKSQRLNEWIGWISGGIILLPFLWFRYFHLAHHRHTNDPENDPELATPKPETWRSYMIHVTGAPYWFSQFTTLFRNAFFDPSAPYLPERATRKVRLESRVLLGIYTLVFGSLFLSNIALTLWIIPLILGQPFLRLYLLAEHGRCPEVANMLENTRTVFTHRVIRFLAWNMPYHIEHHSFPTVPFHALPKLHQHMKNDLISTSKGYRAFTNEFAKELH
jgi:fatty acid desaturase